MVDTVCLFTDGVPYYVLQPYSDRTSNGFINDWVETWVFLRSEFKVNQVIITGILLQDMQM